MVNKIVRGLVNVVIVVVLFVIPLGIAGYLETHYNREGVVTTVQGKTILVTDTIDIEWEFEGEGFDEGDRVTMKMFTNYTDFNIYDDEIEDVKIIK